MGVDRAGRPTVHWQSFAKVLSRLLPSGSAALAKCSDTGTRQMISYPLASSSDGEGTNALISKGNLQPMSPHCLCGTVQRHGHLASLSWLSCLRPNASSSRYESRTNLSFRARISKSLDTDKALVANMFVTGLFGFCNRQEI